MPYGPSNNSINNNTNTNNGQARERRERFLNVKSLSQESAMSSASSRGSANRPGGKMLVGGSYSATTGGSSKIADSWSPFAPPGTNRPRLAQVATALMKAKAEGNLPSALKVVGYESNRAAIERQAAAAAAEGPPDPPPAALLNPLIRREPIPLNDRRSSLPRPMPPSRNSGVPAAAGAPTSPGGGPGGGVPNRPPSRQQSVQV